MAGIERECANNIHTGIRFGVTVLIQSKYNRHYQLKISSFSSVFDDKIEKKNKKWEFSVQLTKLDKAWLVLNRKIIYFS